MTPLFSVAEINVVYRHRKRKQLAEAPVITCSADAYTYLLNGFDQNTISLQEQFVVLYLNQANKPIGLYRASTGGLTGTVADIRMILSVALKIASVALVIAHNHPSCRLKPSQQNVELTRKLKEAAALMDIKLLDHLIIAPTNQYFSFADEGML